MIQDVLQDRNKVVVRSEISGTQKAPFMGPLPKNRKVLIQAIDIHEFKDGNCFVTSAPKPPRARKTTECVEMSAMLQRGCDASTAAAFDFTGLSRRRNRGSFSGMSATLTINLDADVLQLAEQEAKERHTTLPEVVAHQLRVMARNWQESKAGRTAVTDALRGAVKLPPDFDERAALTEELQKKHGVQG